MSVLQPVHAESPAFLLALLFTGHRGYHFLGEEEKIAPKTTLFFFSPTTHLEADVVTPLG